MRFVAPKLPVSRIFVHCSASDRPGDDNVATIDRWHRENGWSGIGYHYFISKDGRLHAGRSLELTPAAQGGHNRGTIAICLHGLRRDRFTEPQLATLRDLCAQIDGAYGPGRVSFHGHNEVARRDCPVIDHRAVLELDPRGRLGVRLVAGGRPEADADMPALPDRLIRRGNNTVDRAVIDLQNMLTRLGFNPGPADGWFGGRTEAAVIAFQRANDLVPDGIVGALTREALGHALGA